MEMPYTREKFDLLRSASKKANKRASTITAMVSVIMGISGILFLNWTKQAYSLTNHKIISVLFFLFYIGIVLWLMYRMKRINHKFAVKCPQCDEDLINDAERIASATGNCEKCGGTVILKE